MPFGEYCDLDQVFFSYSFVLVHVAVTVAVAIDLTQQDEKFRLICHFALNFSFNGER